MLRPATFRGFTLAEILISLSILGVIATFTIPKIIGASMDGQYKAKAKEAAAMVSGAFQTYQLKQTVTGATAGDDLIQYMNYVTIDSTSSIDLFPGSTTRACNSGYKCLKLHNGGMLLYSTGGSFGNTAPTSAIYFYFDPDGQVTDGTTNGPGKSVVFWLYANGQITSYSNLKSGTVNGSAGAVAADPSYDPSWFSW